MNSEEKKYQKQFCDRYFGKTTWDQEVNRVDVVLKGKRGQNLLYIEFKYLLNGQQAHRKALAQIIITNKKRPPYPRPRGLGLPVGEWRRRA